IETLPRRGYRYIGPVVVKGENTRMPVAISAAAAEVPQPTKILVVDDHVLIREALRAVFCEVAAGAMVLEATDARTAMPLIEANRDIALVLLDLSLPDRDGFAVLAELRERYPKASIVVLSALQDRVSVMKALEQGALGFIPKSSTRDVMIQALRLVFAG